jgi:hypothetical protein
MERNEDLLQYIWKFQLFSTPLKDQQGNPFEVIDPGQPNADSGPDFFNARINAGPLTWAGNVEIHMKASDWYRHGHHLDPAYDNVILHAVAEKDRVVLNSNGREILTVKLEIHRAFRNNYQNLAALNRRIPDRTELDSRDRDWFHGWLERLYTERLEERMKAVKLSLADTGNDWEEVLFRAMGRAMGQKTNAQPFDMLTRTLSLKSIYSCCPDLHSKESILFGQAGMLAGTDGDDYYLAIRETYEILRRKLELIPMDSFLWKYLRLRPMNFPDIRIAQFAWMLDKYSALLSRLINAGDPAAFVMNMRLGTSRYWMTHYRLNKQGLRGERLVGKERLSGLLINAVVPVLSAYMQEKGRSLDQLEISHIPKRLPVENNRVIRVWKNIGILATDSFTSQAILQLTKKLGL